MSKVEHDVLEAIAKLRSGKDIAEVIAEGVKPDEATQDFIGMANTLIKDTKIKKAADDNLIAFVQFLKDNSDVKMTDKHYRRLAATIINTLSND